MPINGRNDRPHSPEFPDKVIDLIPHSHPAVDASISAMRKIGMFCRDGSGFPCRYPKYHPYMTSLKCCPVPLNTFTIKQHVRSFVCFLFSLPPLPIQPNLAWGPIELPES